MRAYAATWPTVPGAVNEDAVAVTAFDGPAPARPAFGVVVDGAGVEAKWRSGCRHEVAWFSAEVTERMFRRREDDAPLRELLRETLAEVRDLHADTCDLESGSPSATLAAWRYVPQGDGGRLDHLVLCDASIVLRWGPGDWDAPDATWCEETTDLAVRDVASQIARDFAAANPHLTPGTTEFRAGRTRAIENLRNKPGGFWLCGPDPRAADAAVAGSVEVDRDGRSDDGRRLLGVVAASDGATRGFQEFGLHSLETFTTQALRGEDGLVALHAAIRTHEDSLASDSRRPRKLHDDLSLAALSLEL